MVKITHIEHISTHNAGWAGMREEMNEMIKVRITARRQETYTADVEMPKAAYERHIQTGRIHDRFWAEVTQRKMDNINYWLDADDFDDDADIAVINTPHDPNIRLTEKDITNIEEDIET